MATKQCIVRMLSRLVRNIRAGTIPTPADLPDLADDWARIFAHTMDTELDSAVDAYLGGTSPWWPMPGQILALTPIAQAAALLGNDDEGEASWAHMHRRMPRIGFDPDRDVPARWLHADDPTKNDALFRALDRFGGVDRFREIPTQDANPAGYGAAKKAWIACFTAARKAQGADVATVRQIVASQPRQIEARR